MKKLRAWMVRLGGLLPNQQRERELADEIESHLQLHIEDNLRLGMTEEQARRSALLQLGGVESTKENYRERSTVAVRRTHAARREVRGAATAQERGIQLCRDLHAASLSGVTAAPWR